MRLYCGPIGERVVGGVHGDESAAAATYASKSFSVSAGQRSPL